MEHLACALHLLYAGRECAHHAAQAQRGVRVRQGSPRGWHVEEQRVHLLARPKPKPVSAYVAVRHCDVVLQPGLLEQLPCRFSALFMEFESEQMTGRSDNTTQSHGHGAAAGAGFSHTGARPYLQQERYEGDVSGVNDLGAVGKRTGCPQLGRGSQHMNESFVAVADNLGTIRLSNHRGVREGTPFCVEHFAALHLHRLEVLLPAVHDH
mmetsp:Transcript_3055/g.7446  ORF Transcript_3055/g.7446 Transcript_3055/m.7446 type:complete len:209 (+) Transcript_3055:400-1026(+)